MIYQFLCAINTDLGDFEEVILPIKDAIGIAVGVPSFIANVLSPSIRACTSIVLPLALPIPIKFCYYWLFTYRL